MSLQILAEAVPLNVDADGVVRVGPTRVTLDTVVSSFNDGATPEEIVNRYSVLSLPDVYSVISYYLRRSTEVDAYLDRRREEATTVRKQNEGRFDPHGVRDRLMARRTKQG